MLFWFPYAEEFHFFIIVIELEDVYKRQECIFQKEMENIVLLIDDSVKSYHHFLF